MAWILVILAGLFEVAMALCLKAGKNFSEPWPSAGFLFFAVTSFGLLGFALKTLDVGTATLGMLLMGDQVSAVKIGALLCIIVGVVGLNLAGGGH